MYLPARSRELDRGGKTKEEDERLKEELLADEKERAEHVMLVDLARNDMGRISEFGTVKVTEFMQVHNYSHVMHLVSQVEGRKKERFTRLICWHHSSRRGH